MWRALLLLTFAVPAYGESLVATNTLRAGSIIGPEDIVVVDAKLAGAISDPADAIGLEARVAIYAGKPVRMKDLGLPTIVERNQLVPLVFQSSGLAITTEGRTLDSGSVGEAIRVMNVGSRNTVTGRVGPDGTIYVERE